MFVLSPHTNHPQYRPSVQGLLISPLCCIIKVGQQNQTRVTRLYYRVFEDNYSLNLQQANNAYRSAEQCFDHLPRITMVGKRDVNPVWHVEDVKMHVSFLKHHYPGRQSHSILCCTHYINYKSSNVSKRYTLWMLTLLYLYWICDHLKLLGTKSCKHFLIKNSMRKAR